MILKANNLKYTYASKKLIDDICLSIEDHDKIGLIGINGSGKSTLLSILAMVKDPEKGTVELIGDKKISYMMQEVDLDCELTINEYINHYVSKEEVLVHEAKAILTKLEITDFTKKIGDLSGGSKRKLSLGAALVRPCDLLILDEPTNHLDNDITEWLEKRLAKFNKALLMVTHDRYFLERVANVIVELDKGKLYYYQANYSKYLQLKSEREEALIASNRKMQAFLRKEYEWIKRGPQARATKDRRRIENYESLTNVNKTQEKSLVIESTSSRLGNKTIELINVSKSYDELLFSSLHLNLNKDERIGIIGKNGTGKTSLLDMISQNTIPDSGEIQIGQTVKIGYFKQENIDLNEEKRVIEYIKDIASYVKTKDGMMSASQMLENFLFDDPYVYISKLSGGEKRRLYLLGILMSSPNVLLLDEPTNDLDITTLTILEDYLDEFIGIVIVVSHDRFFLDRVCEKLLVLENKRFQQYIGNYEDYLETRKNTQKDEKNDLIDHINQNSKSNRKVKLTYSEEKEFATILFEIDEIEKEIKRLEQEIINHYGDYQVIKEIDKPLDELNQKLEEKMTRWEYLNDKNEKSLSKD